MRYIGAKSPLLEDIYNTILQNTDGVESIIDIFAGSGTVSSFFKSKNYRIYSNDIMYFSYVLNRGVLEFDKQPSFTKLGIRNPIDFLNNLTLETSGYDLKGCFIYNNYSPNENCERKYFQPKNAIKIDIIRIQIEDWYRQNKLTESEYYYLLSSLLLAVPYVSNIAGVYGAYLKFWDKRAFNDLELTEPKIIYSNKENKFFNMDCNDLLRNIKADLLYADPPYNKRQYLPNYHILETIARYDNPLISGITGIREYKHQKSVFCKKTKVKEAFENMIKSAQVKYIVISYNNEGLLSTQELSDICKKYSKKGTFKLTEIDYRRYKSKIPNNNIGLKEQIYFFEKEDIMKKTFYKSPLNYIGGKYKLLPQLIKYFPQNINNFVDLFAGGCDVCTNMKAKNIYANDINHFVIDIYKKIQEISSEELIEYIESTIEKWQLNMTDKESYLEFRKNYNMSKTKNPLDLYILICFAFNHQIRFNSKHEFNTPFGKYRSCFNSKIKTNLIKFHKNVQNINFSSCNFKKFDISFIKDGDFVYADPPYLITTGSYNDGKRGFEGWCENDDAVLFKILDKINAQNGKFALSNVIEHKGLKNEKLIKWMKKYNIHYINFDYKNSNYHSKNTENLTKEVLITNY